MAQVQNNPREQAMKANLPQAAIRAISNAFATHHDLATRLLSDEESRTMFLDIVYEMLKQDQSAALILAAREKE